MNQARDSDAFVAAYAGKPAQYYAGARADFVALLPVAPEAVLLDVGCATGGTGGLALAERKCGRFVGIELMEAAAKKAREVSSEIIVGNIEHMELQFPDETFDVVILSEVLEHLAWPGLVLKKIGPKMKPGGIVLASSPNIAHWKIVRDLLRGKFDPTDFGIMDRTHLRWFTPVTYQAMFSDAGYDVERVFPMRTLKGSKRVLAAITGRPTLFWPQICLAARWPGLRAVGSKKERS
ncbi:MAG: methyltransferase domain-containing protein [Hyphomicrobiales bacterium]|nr:methyltransferase domain-containing protein [Hyphomicrobiales bacterium]